MGKIILTDEEQEVEKVKRMLLTRLKQLERRISYKNKSKEIKDFKDTLDTIKKFE